jgi:translation initiation factor 2 subunit 1
VNEKKKKDAMSRWNKEKKAEKFLDQLADELDRDKEELYEEVIFPMQKEFGGSFTGFEISVGEEERLQELFDDELVDAIQKVAKDNINLKQEKFEAEIMLEYDQGNGVERIKESFEDMGEGVEVKYVSAPKYAVTAWGRNTELAKKRMDEARKQVEKKADELDGEFEFVKV